MGVMGYTQHTISCYCKNRILNVNSLSILFCGCLSHCYGTFQFSDGIFFTRDWLHAVSLSGISKFDIITAATWHWFTTEYTSFFKLLLSFIDYNDASLLSTAGKKSHALWWFVNAWRPGIGSSLLWLRLLQQDIDDAIWTTRDVRLRRVDDVAIVVIISIRSRRPSWFTISRDLLYRFCSWPSLETGTLATFDRVACVLMLK